MPPLRWSLQDATNQFDIVVDAALAGEPQLIVDGDCPLVVVVAAEAFERMRRAEAPTFVEMLLSMPQGGGGFDRAEMPPRDVEF